MEITIKAEPKEILEFLRERKSDSDALILDFELVGTQRWESQREIIKKISAEYSGNCNLRISAKTFA